MKIGFRKANLLMLLLGMLIALASIGISGIKVDAAATHYLRPYQVSGMESLDSDDIEKSFTMMGVRYTHGLRWSGHAEFNLKKQVDTVSFKVGHIDNAGYDQAELKIYLDGVLQEDRTRTLTGDMTTETVTVNTTGKQQLKIVIDGRSNYGIGNIIETGNHNYVMEITKVATVQEDGILTYKCQDCGAQYTQKDPAKKYCTNYLSPYQISGMQEIKEIPGSETYISVMGEKYYRGLSGSGTALYNLNRSYSSFSFSIGRRDNRGSEDDGTLKLYLDGTLVKTVVLTPTMLTQDIQVSTSGVTQLKVEVTTNWRGEHSIININAVPVSGGNKAHSFEEEVLTEASFGVQGSVRHVCSVCGAYYVTTSPALTRDLKEREVSFQLDQTDYTYNGKARNPRVTVRYGSDTLTQNKDYTVSYKNNVNPGKATVTITGKGGYTGSISSTYIIRPSRPTLSSVKSSKKKKLTVKWKKQASVSGYELEYSTSPYFYYYYTKTKTLTKTSKTLTGLSRKTKYYVRIRSYKKIDGQKYYSAYSKVKKAKVK